jgi:hypothetical protein
VKGASRFEGSQILRTCAFGHEKVRNPDEEVWLRSYRGRSYGPKGLALWGLVESGVRRELEDRGSKGNMYFGIRKPETPTKGDIEGCSLVSTVGWTMA